MGIFVRPRRPIARLAAGAATAGIAYNAGKGHEANSQQANGADQQQQYAPSQYVPPVPEDTGGSISEQTGELETLAQLHDSGALTDSEFSAAKSRLLGL